MCEGLNSCWDYSDLHFICHVIHTFGRDFIHNNLVDHLFAILEPFIYFCRTKFTYFLNDIATKSNIINNNISSSYSTRHFKCITTNLLIVNSSYHILHIHHMTWHHFHTNLQHSQTHHVLHTTKYMYKASIYMQVIK